MTKKSAEDEFQEWLFDFMNSWPASPNTGRSPRLVYQYTSAAGLLGLLKSNRIWASDAACLNDPGEIRYAADILGRSFAKAIGLNVLPAMQDLMQFAGGALARLASRVPVFIACFSAAPDSLTQWRAYGDDGRGFAVGIELARIAPDSLIQVGGPAFRRRVLYGNRLQSSLATQVAQAAARYVQSTHGRPDATTVAFIQQCIVECSVCFKHPAYQDEREWRAIYTGHPFQPPLPVAVREKNGGLIPYVELEMPDTAPPYNGKLAIREIVIGPRNDMTATRKLLSDTLSAIWGTQLAQEIRVRDSTVPYRG